MDRLDAFGEFMIVVLRPIAALLWFGDHDQLQIERQRIPLWLRRIILVTLPISWPILFLAWLIGTLFAMLVLIAFIGGEAFWTFLRTMWNDRA